MQITFHDGVYNPILFGYKSQLKTLYGQGKLKGLKSFSGEELTQPSVDHIKPKSKGGKSDLGNYVLTNQKENSERGSKNIDFYLEKNLKGAIEYINWFWTHKVDGFDCIGYVQRIIKAINAESEKFKIISEIFNND